MLTLILALLIFIQMLEYLILADVILSWFMLAGIKIRPRFISNFLDPLYALVKKYIPTQIGPLEFTPIVLILILMLVRIIITIAFPEINTQINTLLNIS